MHGYITLFIGLVGIYSYASFTPFCLFKHAQLPLTGQGNAFNKMTARCVHLRGACAVCSYNVFVSIGSGERSYLCTLGFWMLTSVGAVWSVVSLVDVPYSISGSFDTYILIGAFPISHWNNHVPIILLEHSYKVSLVNLSACLVLCTTNRFIHSHYGYTYTDWLGSFGWAGPNITMAFKYLSLAPLV